MGFVVLTQLTRVPAEATVERLAGLGIEARLLDDPNVFTKGSTGGRYLVRVSVDEQNLERAQAELARWEVEAAPRVAALAREVRGQFVLGSLPALVVLVVLLVGGWMQSLGFLVPLVWFGGLVGLMIGSRWYGPSRRAPGDGPPQGG